jgi:hypothetical protein
MTNSVLDQNVPIVGQQIVAEGYTIAVIARCRCKDGGSAVLMSVTCSQAGTAASVGQCPSCGLAYSVRGMDLDKQARLMFNIAVLTSENPQES